MPETDNMLQKIADLILDRTGIYIKEKQLPGLKVKLDRVLRDWKITDYGILYGILDKSPYGDRFFDIVNEISVNVTDFCRQVDHFFFLRDILAPRLAGKSGTGPFRIWSAACATGEEPYSILMALLEGFRICGAAPPALDILATDISPRSLKTAGEGVYELERVKNNLPDADCLARYFQEGFGISRGFVRIKDALRKKVRFLSLNLNGEVPYHNEFDIVFLRNVLIYFSRPKQREILEKMCRALKKEGLLFLGFSETARGLDLPLDYVQPAVYRRF